MQKHFIAEDAAICPKCGETKHISEFYLQNRTKPTGETNKEIKYCKTCGKAASRIGSLRTQHPTLEDKLKYRKWLTKRLALIDKIIEEDHPSAI